MLKDDGLLLESISRVHWQRKQNEDRGERNED